MQAIHSAPIVKVCRDVVVAELDMSDRPIPEKSKMCLSISMFFLVRNHEFSRNKVEKLRIFMADSA